MVVVVVVTVVVPVVVTVVVCCCCRCRPLSSVVLFPRPDGEGPYAVDVAND